MKTKAQPAPPMPEIDTKYQTEEDMRTLMRHQEILADPERVKRLHTHAKKHAKVVSSLQDLKDKYNEKFGAKMKMAKDKDSDGV